jgi:protease-4
MTAPNDQSSPEGARNSEMSLAIVSALDTLRVWVDAREREMRSEARWRAAKRAGLVLMFTITLGLTWATYRPLLTGPANASGDAVAIIEIAGPIGGQGMSTADRLVPIIDRTCKTERLRALVLRINSGGGAPTDAERIVAAIQACREKTPTLPIVAAIEGTGASAAYLIAASADTVLASRYSVVGSIGAVMRSLDASEGFHRLGLKERTYASGPLKAGGSVGSPNTPEQDAVYQSVVDDVGRAFAEQVHGLRAHRLGATTEDLFSGRVWPAEEARALGLVDEVVLLDDYLRREHADAPRQLIKPRATWQEQLSLRSLLGAAIEQLHGNTATPTVEG